MTQQSNVQKIWKIVTSAIGDQYDLLNEEGKIMSANIHYADARFMKSLHEEAEAQRIRADKVEQEVNRLKQEIKRYEK